MEYLIPVIVFGVFAYLFYTVFTKSGRGKLLGGNIVWSGKRHVLDKTEFTGSKIQFQVHTVATKSEPIIGLELRHTSYGGFSVQPVSLSKEQARLLVNELNEAITHAST